MAFGQIHYNGTLCAALIENGKARPIPGVTALALVLNPELAKQAASPRDHWQPALPIHPPEKLGDNAIKLTFVGGDPGVSYRVEVSPDLNATNWSTLITNLAGTNGLPTLIDWGATNHAHRFYRTVTP